MAHINWGRREVNIKIVYYGPGLSGKTTNLEMVHKRAPQSAVGQLTSIATEGDRTLFFDFLPLDLGEVAGMRTKFQLYTVPGQAYYNSTRKLVLQGTDGIIFVSDSTPDRREDNLESLRNLETNLQEIKLDLANMPWVLQFNKRDHPAAMPLEAMQAELNKAGVPTFEAVAKTGDGVMPTLKALSKLVLEKLNKDYARSGTTAAPTPHPAPAPTVHAAPVPSAATGAAVAATVLAPAAGAGAAAPLPAVQPPAAPAAPAAPPAPVSPLPAAVPALARAGATPAGPSPFTVPLRPLARAAEAPSAAAEPAPVARPSAPDLTAPARAPWPPAPRPAAAPAQPAAGSHAAPASAGPIGRTVPAGASPLAAYGAPAHGAAPDARGGAANPFREATPSPAHAAAAVPETGSALKIVLIAVGILVVAGVVALILRFVH